MNGLGIGLVIPRTPIQDGAGGIPDSGGPPAGPDNTYKQPDGTSDYKQPDGVSYYLQPS